MQSQGRCTGAAEYGVLIKNEKMLLGLFEGEKSRVDFTIRGWAIKQLGELGSERALPVIQARLACFIHHVDKKRAKEHFGR